MAATTTRSTSRGARAKSLRHASDDEILGIAEENLASPEEEAGSAAGNSAASPADAAEMSPEAAAEPAALRGVFDSHPALRRAWHAERAYREIFPSIEAARGVAKHFPTPEEAQAAGAQLAELAHLDSLFFSRRPEDHAALAQAVARLDPAAFESFAQAVAAVLQQSRQGAGQALPADAANAAPAPNFTKAEEAREAGAMEPAAALPRSGAAAFFHEANTAAVEGVLAAVESQVDRLLPEGVSAGTRNRIVGEIYRELDASLRSNRTLAQQLRQAFRSGARQGGGAEHQRAVAGLIISRARQALPGVARRVISEWTSSVLAANREKLARQKAAAQRVDISGAGSSAGLHRRPLSPREIDYAKMSDADILNL